MRDNGILDTINTLIVTDPACLDRQGIRDVMAKIRHVQGWASAGLLECTRRLEELSTASNPGADAGFTLAGVMDQTGAEATSTVGQAELCNTNTELEDSLAAGEITARHLALIARYRSRLEAHERSDFDLEIPRIHRWAREQHFKMFEQSLKDLIAQIRHRHHPADEMAELEQQRNASKLKSWVEDSTGLHNFLLTMDPVRAAKFTSAYQAELAALRAAKQDRREPFGSLMIQAVINALGAYGLADTNRTRSSTPANVPGSNAVTSNVPASDAATSSGPTSHGAADTCHDGTTPPSHPAGTVTDPTAAGYTTNTTTTDKTKADLNLIHNSNNPGDESPHVAADQSEGATPGQATSRSSELIVVVDHQTLTTGRHDNTLCETIDGAPLPVPFVRELCQEALINLFALDQHGTICDAIGERTANREQRRALAAMYRSCSFPNCTVPFSQTRMHHIHYSRDGGNTQLCNLIPLCETHHHHIHDLGWSLTMDPTTRQATFTQPGTEPDTDSRSGIHKTRPDRQRSGSPPDDHPPPDHDALHRTPNPANENRSRSRRTPSKPGARRAMSSEPADESDAANLSSSVHSTPSTLF